MYLYAFYYMKVKANRYGPPFMPFVKINRHKRHQLLVSKYYFNLSVYLNIIFILKHRPAQGWGSWGLTPSIDEIT